MSGTQRGWAAKSHIAATLGNMVCLNVTVSSVFGVFLIPMATDLGWPRSQVTGALALIAFLSVLAYPPVGQLIDRFGARRVIVLGSALFAASLIGIKWLGSGVAEFYGYFALIGVLGAAPSTAMLAKVISGWFDARRGLMLGLAAGLGNGVGATFMPLVAASLLDHYDWRTSYSLIGVLCFLIATPAITFWLREAPPGLHDMQAPNAEPVPIDLAKILRSSSFWLIFSSVGLVAGCLTAIFSHVVPLLSDRQFSLSTASSIMAVMAMSAAGGQVLCGAMLDHVNSPRVIIPVYVLAILGLAGLLLANQWVPLVLSGAALGGALGMTYAALPYFISRYFGLAVFGRVAGFVYAAVMLAQGFMPFGMDVWFDLMGSYTGAVMIVSACLVGACLLVALLPPYAVALPARKALAGMHEHVGI
jgi:MFS family permease